MSRKWVAIGSSATKGFQIEQRDAWPEQLEAVCRERGHDVRVLNRATHGLAMQAYAERILHLEETEAPELYLLQLPIPGRLYVGVNGSGLLSETDGGKEVAFGWSAKTAHVSPTRLLLTGGAVQESSPFHKYLKSFYHPLVQRNNPETDYGQFMAFLTFWESNVKSSDLEYVQYAKEVVLIQHVMERIGKPYLMFEWIGHRLFHNTRRHRPFDRLIDWEPFLHRGRYHVYDLLRQALGAGHAALLHDNFGHLNRDGNRFVAEHIVFPAVAGRLGERDDESIGNGEPGFRILE